MISGGPRWPSTRVGTGCEAGLRGGPLPRLGPRASSEKPFHANFITRFTNWQILGLTFFPVLTLSGLC
jgi:hypothetical protein